MKLIHIFVLLVGLLLIAGCGEVQEEVPVDDTTNPSESDLSQEEPVELEEDEPSQEEVPEEETTPEEEAPAELDEEVPVEENTEPTDTNEDEGSEEPQDPEDGEQAQEEPEPVELNCPGTNPASGAFDMQVKVSIVKKSGTIEPSVEMDGTSGKISIPRSEPFKATAGVDWYQVDLNVHKGDCNGELIDTLPFRWEDGDQNKEQEFSVPEQGCYCVKVTQDDLTIKTGDISMTSGDEFTLEFSTA